MEDANSVTQSIERIWPEGGWLRRNWKVLASTVATAIVTSGGWLASKSFDAGMNKSESAKLAEKLDSLAGDVKRANESLESVKTDLNTVKTEQAVMKSQVSDVHDWKEKVTGVADSTPIARLTPQGHRTRH